MSESNIEWTGHTWNPIVGCSVVSPGCTNCYAMKMAGRLERMGMDRYAGLTKPSKAGAVWTGQMRLVEDALTLPLQRKKPTTYFVNSMSDLFHENAPDAWIDRIFAVMALCPQHTFQVLTKRAARMRSYFTADDILDRSESALRGLMDQRSHFRALGSWPLPNVWLGVSAEDQTRADERVPDLLATPAAVRFVSAEPLLGPIDYTAINTSSDGYSLRLDSLRGISRHKWHREFAGPGYDPGLYGMIDNRKASLDWIIVGGESGPNARPMHPQWARDIRDQCAAAGTSFFMKQWGAWAPIDHSDAADEAGWQGRGDWMLLSRDGDLDIPDGRWPDEEAGEVAIVRVGKKAAGRLLDGVEHNGMPVQSLQVSEAA